MLRYDVTRHYPTTCRTFLFGFDVVWVIWAAMLGHRLRFGHFTLTPQDWNVLGFTLVAAIIVLRAFGLYEPLREKPLWHTLFNGSLAILCIFGLLSIFTIITKINPNYSRMWLAYWFLFLWVGFAGSRCALYGMLRYLRLRGFNVKRVIIIGTNPRAQNLVASLLRTSWAGVTPLFFYSPTPTSEKKIGNLRVHSFSLHYLIKMTRRADIDEVWIALPLKEEELIQNIAEQLIQASITVRYVPDFLGLSLRRHTMSEISGFPLINLYSTPMEGERRWLKALEDRGLAVIFLILALPIMLLIAASIKLTSPGPIFFCQKRHGWNGKEFNVYKFRSMVCHAEKTGYISQATRQDQRVTRIGRFLRRTSLDEIPQLLNVLQGHMSIVGPRPHAVAHNEHYKNLVTTYMQRFRMKPGITGWAQVNGYRGETDTLEKMQRRVEFDVYYIENWTLTFDLYIIALTLWRGFLHHNAY